MQVADTTIDIGVAELAFDHPQWSPMFDNDEVDFAAVGVAEIAQVDIPPRRVLLKVHPFQQVGRDQILEPGRVVGHRAPVEVIVLLFLLDGANARHPNGREAKNCIESLECPEPARDRLVRDLQILAQRIDGQRRAHQIRETPDQKLERAEIHDALERGSLVMDESGSVIARQTPCQHRVTAEVRLWEAAQCQEAAQLFRRGQAQFRDR